MATSPANTERRFSGLPISGGIAAAKVCLLNEDRHNRLPVYRVSGEGIAGEKERVRRAIEMVTARLDVLIGDVADRIGPAEAQIFQAQKMIVTDRVLVEQIVQDIETLGLNAEAAITQTLDTYESRLLEMDNEYIKERAGDISDIRRRLLDALGNLNPELQCGGEEHCGRGRNRIIVAEELTASLTVELDTERAMGFVTARGGPTSHAAILARALGIPAVGGVKDIHTLLSCGTELLLDGNSGEVVLWPSEETIARAQSRQMAATETGRVVGPVPELSVLANISHASDVEEVLRYEAEGIGLYRTEFEFLAAGRVLDEDEQFERYRSVVEAMGGRPTCVRLLDLGGDKGTQFLDLPREANPHLGFRGARLLLERTELVRAQARAIARASRYGPVDVLYPMIVDRQQFLKLKQVFREAVADLPVGEVRHGVMFEVPSACLDADELFEVADFGSVGTNDLIQYLFAVDRSNELVAYDYTPDRPVFWSILGGLAAAAAQAGRTLSVCGEVASNPQFVPKLIELGLTTLSVSPRFIPQLRLTAKQRRKKERTHSTPATDPSASSRRNLPGEGRKPSK